MGQWEKKMFCLHHKTYINTLVTNRLGFKLVKLILPSNSNLMLG